MTAKKSDENEPVMSDYVIGELIDSLRTAALSESKMQLPERARWMRDRLAKIRPEDLRPGDFNTLQKLRNNIPPARDSPGSADDPRWKRNQKADARANRIRVWARPWRDDGAPSLLPREPITKNGKVMAVYKRGNVSWFKFTYNGEQIRESANTANKRTAEQIEAARKTQFAKNEVGIETKNAVPTLREFAARFMATIETTCAEKPKTIRFYSDMLGILMEHERFAGARLDTIDESAIDTYASMRSRTKSGRGRIFSPASINRELATLRRLLRLAHEWKVINRVPRIRLLRGEKNRQFVLSHQQEPAYLAVLPDPLNDIAILLLDTGLRLGELYRSNGNRFTCGQPAAQRSGIPLFLAARRSLRSRATFRSARGYRKY